MTARARLVAAASRPLEVVNAVVRLLYTGGVLQEHRAAVPVVSVGNIAVGGTGKTPLVATLARELAARGRRPAILTRGYRRQHAPPVVASGHDPISWQLIGDEPALLSRALPDIPIVVDPDRVRGASTAVTVTGADVLLLDDGFQHWRLARDLDVVTVDALDPLCLRRPRRESPRALGRADAIVLTGMERGEVADAMHVIESFAPRAVRIPCTTRATWLHRSGQRDKAEVLRGARVLALAGLASPERFFATLEGLGAVVVRTVRRPDHHPHTEAEVAAIISEAAALGAEVVMTAKDVVKMTPELAAAVSWLEIEAVLPENSVAELLDLIPGAPGLESRA